MPGVSYKRPKQSKTLYTCRPPHERSSFKNDRIGIRREVQGIGSIALLASNPIPPNGQNTGPAIPTQATASGSLLDARSSLCRGPLQPDGSESAPRNSIESTGPVVTQNICGIYNTHRGKSTVHVSPNSGYELRVAYIGESAPTHVLVQQDDRETPRIPTNQVKKVGRHMCSQRK